MVVYRKQKMYKEEPQLINEAITNILNASNTQVSKFKSMSNIAKLSNTLMKSTGFIDKKISSPLNQSRYNLEEKKGNGAEASKK